MDLNTVLTHGLTYLAALALPLWLLGEYLVGRWVLRKPTAEAEDKAAMASPKRQPTARLQRKAA
jgi:hypothetical protein